MAKKGSKGEKAPKSKGSASQGPKKSKIPRPVQGRGFAMLGLLALLPIAWQLFQGSLDLESAAQRAVLVMVGLMVIERLIAPVFVAVLHSGHQRQETPDTEADAVEEPAA